MKKKFISLDINLLRLVSQHSVEIILKLLIGKRFDTHTHLVCHSDYLSFDRYENTIAGQFFGHAHSEELKVFYDEVDKQRPVSMVCVSVYFLYHVPLRIYLIILGLYWSITNNLFIFKSRLSCIYNRW